MKRSILLAAVLMTGIAAFAQSGAISGKVSGIPRAKALPGAFPPPPTPAVVYAVPLAGKPLLPVAGIVRVEGEEPFVIVPAAS